MIPIWLRIALVVAILAGGATLRLFDLDRRVMHGDEAVQAVKAAELRSTGHYVYDPEEFHGPALPYLTLPVLWLCGAKELTDVSASTLRVVPALVGLGLVVLTLLAGRGLGREAALAAALLTAISPAMVFYSRFFIHEILLVFFTLGCLLSAWRLIETGSTRAGLALGACAGLMHATKETAIIAFTAMLGAALGTWLWERRGGGESPDRGRGILAAVTTAVLVSVVLYSGFFTHASGPIDSLHTFATYLQRAAGGTVHEHPWGYYLGLLTYTRHPPGPYWSEAIILLLAGVGALFVLLGRSRDHGSRPVQRFLVLYTLLMTVGYSTIPYKTPWCALEFLQPMLLLAGIGVVSLIRVFRLPAVVTRMVPWLTPVTRLAIGAVLLVGCADLAWQSYLASFRFHTDPRNPYVYAHPGRDVERLSAWIQKLAVLHRDGQSLAIQVIADNYWPLPWYLREFPRVGYWHEPPPRAQLAVPVVIVATELHDQVEPHLRDTHRVSHYGLRPDAVLEVFIDNGLWERFVAADSTPR